MKKNNILVSISIVLLVIILSLVIYFMFFMVQTPESFNAQYFSDTDTTYETSPYCRFTIPQTTACKGETVTSTVNGFPNGNCFVGYNYENTGWKYYSTVALSSAGKAEIVDSAAYIGDYVFAALCFVGDNTCRTNNDEITITDCDVTPEPDTPTFSDGTPMGDISGSSSISGGESLELQIDLGEPTSGNCGLMATIQTAWDYVNPLECIGVQGGEGIKWSLSDSEGVKWSRIDTTGVGIGSQTECNLVYDGTPFGFKIEKLQNLPQCIISFEYDVAVKTCNCQN